jgi:hypothetical protein
MNIPNFIEVYNNVFTPEYCNKVIECFDIADQHGFTVDRQSHEEAKKLDKQDKTIFLPEHSLHMQGTSKEIMIQFIEGLWGVVYKQYAEKYSILHTCANHKSYCMKIQKTEPGEGYHIWHAESTDRESSSRLLTWTCYLNDDFEAGETEFLYQQYRYKPKQGDVVIFPAAFTHTHRGNPPIGGTKYIITGWIEF